MRKQFVECTYKYEAKKECPWVSVIKRVTEGYLCFESIDEYNTWRNQK